MATDMSKYPDGWRSFASEIKFGRADGRCECTGECGLHGPSLFKKGKRRCVETHGSKAKWAKGRVILSVAHLNAKDGPCQCDPLCSNPAHVKAMCSRCHLRYDVPRHVENATRKRDEKRLKRARRK